MDSIPRLAPRPVDSHKGMYGHGLIVGGAVGMTGAAILAGQSCLRIGAGLTTVACPEASQAIIAMATPCYMTWSWPAGVSAKQLTQSFLEPKWSKCCIGLGPGLGRSQETDAFCVELFRNWPNPMVCDADGLNALSDSLYWREWWTSVRSGSASHSQGAGDGGEFNEVRRILTPHPGEWARLTGTASTDREKQKESAVFVARSLRSVVILKGARTFITDGDSYYENATGNPSLAVGGSGDCLTGLLVGLLCQGLSCLDASRLGVYLHGLAADLAHEELGTPSTLGSDILRYLPDAFRRIPS